MMHITKRKEMPLSESMAIRALSIILALVVCGVITTILTFAATALTVTLVMKLQRHFEKKREGTHDE